MNKKWKRRIEKMDKRTVKYHQLFYPSFLFLFSISYSLLTFSIFSSYPFFVSFVPFVVTLPIIVAKVSLFVAIL